MKSPGPLPIDAAIAHLRAAAPLLPNERVPLLDAFGRILAADLTSLADHPTVDNSALDGYAVRVADTASASKDAPVRLRLIGEVPAGTLFEGTVGPGEAVRIFTGAAIPPGADGIVRVEETREDGDWVMLFQPASGNDIRPRGQDLHAGERYLGAGTRLDAAASALAAGMGHAEVEVRRRPRVAILATGDEVVRPGQPLAPGQVYNSNAFALAALVRAAGGEALLLEDVGDDPDSLARRLADLPPIDLLLTSGGVSMGRYDFVRDLLHDGGEVDFWKVAMKPGGPALFGRWRQLPVLALPGNPVSTMVVFLVLGRAYLDTMLGRTDPIPFEARHPAVAAHAFRASGAKMTFDRVRLSWQGRRLVAESTGTQSSGVLRSMVLADALAVLPPHAEIAAGEPLEVIPLEPHLG